MTLVFLTGQPEYFRPRGYEVHVVSADDGQLVRIAARLGATPHALGLTRRVTPLRDLWAVVALVRLLRRLRPDVVHGHTPKGGVVAMLAGTVARVPVRVYHLRGLAWRPGGGGPRFVRYTERISCRLAQRVFAVSRALRFDAIALGLCPPEKLRVLANGSGNGVDAEGRFDPRRHSAAGMEARRELGISPGDPVIGFVGRLARDKGVAELAAAWRALRGTWPAARLLLVGPVDERDPVEPAVLAELAEDPRVHAAGRVGDTPALYAAMDLVCLPTYREGFPNVPLEAAAMGLPVVASRIPACEEAVVDGTTGTLVPPGDSSALVAAIAAYLSDPGLRRRHGRAARERVLADFRPQTIWAALHREYEALIAAHGRADR